MEVSPWSGSFHTLEKKLNVRDGGKKLIDYKKIYTPKKETYKKDI